MGVGETITVINKSGKVVSNSKHLFGVFKEAKAAYRERKAEIQADRNASIRERKLVEDVKTLRIEDDLQSRASSRHSKHSKASHRSKSHKHSPHPDRPAMQRGYTDNFFAHDAPSSRHHRFEQDLAGNARDAHRQELARRSTDVYLPAVAKRRDSIDMDLAYGDVPPPADAPTYNDVEIKEKASKITVLLDEANCLQYTVSATIESLQKNPEALAAVSLTLAEISALVGKMGPGILVSLKGSFPAVAALLLSPQFMIAGGVAVGVTIVALGGYKIIKKIQAQKDIEAVPMAMPASPSPSPLNRGADEPNQLDELEPQELSRVEVWRRGIADVEAVSAGTSVDGEFVTPGASRHLIAVGVLDEDDLKSRRSTRSRKDGGSEARPKVHRARSEKSSSKKSKAPEPVRRSKTAKEISSGGSSVSVGSKKTKKKEKEPTGLKMLFSARAHAHA